MTELSPEVLAELKEVLSQSQRHPFLRFRDLMTDIHGKKVKPSPATWQRAAEFYCDTVKGLPPCFLLSLFDEVERVVNPYAHLIPCKDWDGEKDSCQLGLDTDKCKDCSSYEPSTMRWSDRCKEKPCPFAGQDDPCCDQGGKPDA